MLWLYPFGRGAARLYTSLYISTLCELASLLLRPRYMKQLVLLLLSYSVQVANSKVSIDPSSSDGANVQIVKKEKKKRGTSACFCKYPSIVLRIKKSYARFLYYIIPSLPSFGLFCVPRTCALFLSIELCAVYSETLYSAAGWQDKICAEQVMSSLQKTARIDHSRPE